MKAITRRKFLATAAAAAAAPSPLSAAEKSLPLFDGKTLDGWHKPPKRIGRGTGGQWLVEKGGITTWINDLEVCRFDGETSTCPGYDKERVFGILGREGSIGLQVHGGKNWPEGKKCRWRNIRVRDL